MTDIKDNKDWREQQFKDLLEAFGTQEDLHPDLQDYLEEGGRFGPMLRHPLVYSMMHAPQLNAMVNKQYLAKLEAVAEALTENEWHSYIFLHERPYRIGAFTNVSGHMSDSDYWELLATIWVDSENIRQSPHAWEELLGADRPGREAMMLPDEREAFDALPDVIDVHQGHTTTAHDGWSWTTDKAVAEWFARRFIEDGEQPVVTSGKVRKDRVIAYLLRRNESEILVPRNYVRNRTKEVLS